MCICIDSCLFVDFYYNYIISYLILAAKAVACITLAYASWICVCSCPPRRSMAAALLPLVCSDGWVTRDVSSQAEL